MSLSLISNATLYCTFSTGSSGCGASACSLDYPAILRDLFPSHSGEVNTRLWPPKCRKTVARARSKVARYRAQGGVTIACIAIPRQSVGEGCDGNRFRGRVHMGSGDWRVWKTLFNPGKALKRSDGHRGGRGRVHAAALLWPQAACFVWSNGKSFSRISHFSP